MATPVVFGGLCRFSREAFSRRRRHARRRRRAPPKGVLRAAREAIASFSGRFCAGESTAVRPRCSPGGYYSRPERLRLYVDGDTGWSYASHKGFCTHKR